MCEDRNTWHRVCWKEYFYSVAFRRVFLNARGAQIRSSFPLSIFGLKVVTEGKKDRQPRTSPLESKLDVYIDTAQSNIGPQNALPTKCRKKVDQLLTSWRTILRVELIRLKDQQEDIANAIEKTWKDPAAKIFFCLNLIFWIKNMNISWGVAGNWRGSYKDLETRRNW